MNESCSIFSNRARPIMHSFICSANVPRLSSLCQTQYWEAEMNRETALQGPIAGRWWNPDSQPGHLTPQACPDSSTPRAKREITCPSAISVKGTHSLMESCQSLIGRRETREDFMGWHLFIYLFIFN